MITFENDLKGEDGERKEIFSNKNLVSTYKRRPNNLVLNALRVRFYLLKIRNSHSLFS